MCQEHHRTACWGRHGQIVPSGKQKHVCWRRNLLNATLNSSLCFHAWNPASTQAICKLYRSHNGQAAGSLLLVPLRQEGFLSLGILDNSSPWCMINGTVVESDQSFKSNMHYRKRWGGGSAVQRQKNISLGTWKSLGLLILASKLPLRLVKAHRENRDASLWSRVRHSLDRNCYMRPKS